MKRILITIMTLALFSSCSRKDITEGNKVEYQVFCDDCTVTYTALNNPVKEAVVRGKWFRSEINSLDTISITTTGTGYISVKVYVNDQWLIEGSELQRGNSVTRSAKVQD